MKGNRGEWSEIYVLFKILADQALYAGTGNLYKIKELFFPIIKVIRDEIKGPKKFSYSDGNVVIEYDENEYIFPLERFLEASKLLLLEIEESKSAAFEVPEIENFLDEFSTKSLKAKSSVKSDIRVVIHDPRTGVSPELGFSIKSQLGNASTLMNAGKTTNFIFRIDGNLTKDEIAIVNDIGSRQKIKDRLEVLQGKDVQLNFERIANVVFENNLTLIDSELPRILAELLLEFNTTNMSTIVDLLKKLEEENPLNYNLSNGHRFYEYKIKRFLTDIALGMIPSKVWNGHLDATGGYLIVKKDGEVLCYHLFNRNLFEDYLLLNTKLETASSTRHEFGKLYLENDILKFNLNLQIRFIK